MSTTTTFRPESITGASCTGSSGSTGRTYTMAYTGYVASTMQIVAQGSVLYEGPDYSISGRVITFGIVILDADLISLRYFTSTSNAVSGSSPRYATTEQLASSLGILGIVPSRIPGSTTMNNEALFAGGSTLSTSAWYFLQQMNIIDGTTSLYTGGTTSATATTLLTPTTHYTMNLTTGGIQFTSAGSTLVGGTNGVFATYEYVTVNVPNSRLQDTILRAEQEVDSELLTTYTDGTATNPAYPSAITYLDSKGKFDRFYFSPDRPILDVTSTLNVAMTSTQTTVVLASGDGPTFPTSGTIIIDNEIMTYTGVSTDTLTGVTRGVNSTTAATHVIASEVHTAIMEVNASYEGSTPTWYALAHHTGMNVDEDTGRWYVYDNQIVNSMYVDNLVSQRTMVPERVRLTYFYGEATVPADITRLTLILAKRSLASDNILGSIVKGRNEFDPQLFNADMEEMSRIMNNHRRGVFGNT